MSQQSLIPRHGRTHFARCRPPHRAVTKGRCALPHERVLWHRVRERAPLTGRSSPLLVAAFGTDGPGDWRLLPTMANRMPTAASYPRAPSDAELKFEVIQLAAGSVPEVTTAGPELFPASGLRPTLDDNPIP